MPDENGLTEKELEELASQLIGATPEEAKLIFDRLVEESWVTQAQLNELFRWYKEDMPLIQREKQIAIDNLIRQVIQDPDVPEADKAALRQSSGMLKTYMKAGDKTFPNMLNNMLSRAEEIRGRAKSTKAEYESQVAESREARAAHIAPAWEQLSKDPLTAQYLEDITETEKEDYLSGKSDDLVAKLIGIPEQANLAVKTQAQQARGAQRAESFFKGMETLRRPAKEEYQRPSLPALEPIAKEFLGETGFAEGTKLRNFLAGQFIPDVIGETGGDREAWWARMHPESQGESYGQYKARLQEKARRWARQAWGPDAQTERVVGGVDYGEGGLAALAETAYRSLTKRLGEVKREDFPERVRRPERTPDPLIGALRSKKFLPEYYRGAGTGLVSRLTPSVRY